MATKRILAIATASVLATMVAATAAQAAYVATGTLYGTAVGQISTIDCRAVTLSSTADDQAKTIEVEGEECSWVTAQIYYTNPSGYAGWSTTVKHKSKAVKTMTGNDQLQKSYHTATR